MRIFDWLRRAFAQATEEGIKDGLRNSGFVPVEGEVGDADRLALMSLWLTKGESATALVLREKAPESDDKAAEPAPAKKGKVK